MLRSTFNPAADAIHESTLAALAEQGLADQTANKQDFVKGNVKARMRMIAQYEIAGLLGGLVLGTDHSAENVTGFYTKYGDGACDIAPLFGLNKRQVRQLATQLGAPEKIITKIPTADLESLAPSKPDEETLGLSYDQIDDFLEGKKIDPEAEQRIIHIFLDHRAQTPAHRHHLRPVIGSPKRQAKKPFTTPLGGLRSSQNASILTGARHRLRLHPCLESPQAASIGLTL